MARSTESNPTLDTRNVAFLEMGKIAGRAREEAAMYRVYETEDLNRFIIQEKGKRKQYEVHLQATGDKGSFAEGACTCPYFQNTGLRDNVACKHMHMVFWAVIKPKSPIADMLEVVKPTEPVPPIDYGKALIDASKEHNNDVQTAEVLLEKETSPVHRPPQQEEALAVVNGETLLMNEAQRLERGLTHFRLFQRVANEILTDKDKHIDGQKEYWKKSAYQKIAAFFGYVVEIIEMSQIKDFVGNPGFWYRVKAIAPDGRFAFGEGSCTKDEPKKPQNWTYHAIRATAYTRAYNRAVCELSGAGVVSKEEL